MDMKTSKRSVIHRGSAWSNEEHNMLFQFWRQNIDKIDLPGRTEDKLKNKIYSQMQAEFLKHGFRRTIKQIRKKIQNLKREAVKFKHSEEIEDENVRERVVTVQEILSMTTCTASQGNKDPRASRRMERDRVSGGRIASALFSDANGSAELWVHELHPTNITQTEQNSVIITPDQFRAEIIDVTQALNKAITANDYEKYQELCEPNLTCFEPEAFGNLVEGLDFHKFYFDSNAFAVFSGEVKVSIVNPKVYQIGMEAACIAYVRILQGMRKEEYSIGRDETLEEIARSMEMFPFSQISKLQTEINVLFQIYYFSRKHYTLILHWN